MTIRETQNKRGYHETASARLAERHSRPLIISVGVAFWSVAILVGAGSGAVFLFLGSMMLIVTTALWFMSRHGLGRASIHTGV